MAAIFSVRMSDISSMQVDDTTEPPKQEEENFDWTAATIAQAIAVFCLAGLCEIAGGWLVWMAIRGNSLEECMQCMVDSLLY